MSYAPIYAVQNAVLMLFNSFLTLWWCSQEGCYLAVNFDICEDGYQW